VSECLEQTNKQTNKREREARVNEKQQHKERQPAHCLEGTVIMMVFIFI
jgi:hypothetical protein